MSLYNMMNGVNPLSSLVLSALGINVDSVPRFRDTFISPNELRILTRTGGGNRDYYENVDCLLRENGFNTVTAYEDEYGEIPALNSNLRENEYYISDEDDEFDCTYAIFSFSVPKFSEALFNKFQGEEVTFTDLVSGIEEAVKHEDAPRDFITNGEMIIKMINQIVAERENSEEDKIE